MKHIVLTIMVWVSVSPHKAQHVETLVMEGYKVIELHFFKFGDEVYYDKGIIRFKTLDYVYRDSKVWIIIHKISDANL